MSCRTLAMISLLEVWLVSKVSNRMRESPLLAGTPCAIRMLRKQDYMFKEKTNIMFKAKEEIMELRPNAQTGLETNTRCQNYLFIINTGNQQYHEYFSNCNLIDKKIIPDG